ncbi:MAG: HPr-rel-A system PqqD family peptide chaperone [Sphingobium sp.]
MAAGTTRYRAEPGQARLVHAMGPMTVIYHRRSGMTHMMSEPVPQILDALDAMGSADAAALTAHLSTRFDLEAEEGGAAEPVIAARLEELAALGLVLRETA